MTATEVASGQHSGKGEGGRGNFRHSPLSPPPSPLLALRHLLAATLLSGAATFADADDTSSPIWIVSTRDAPRCGDLDESLQCLRYSRLEDDCQWVSADAETFQTTNDPAMPTVVFIHGNRTDSQGAVTKGLTTYHLIRACTCSEPFRYVIWSWPAERMCRRINEDTRLKAAYSDVESYYLALWLDQLPPGEKVSLVGHSFGPRIITGALHLLAGGEVAGRCLSQSTVAAWSGGKRNPVRAALLAAAVDAGWLAPGGCHGLALPLVDQMLVTRNGCDRVLRWYPRLYGRGGPKAMGFVGPCGVGGTDHVEVIDVTCTVGKIHDWRCYCSASNVCNRWERYTFSED